MATNDAPPARRCACKDWDARECMRLRYGTASGYDPDDEDFLVGMGEACECSCHEEFRDWADDDY